jgi:hypothetical protein
LINNDFDSDKDFLYYFNSILTKGKKDNTYKCALARFLTEYSYALDLGYIENKIQNNSCERIEFSMIAKHFLIYYWHQICKYKINKTKLSYRETSSNSSDNSPDIWK